jgi:hypothetical protein
VVRPVYFGKLSWFSILAFILIMAGFLAGCDSENQSIDESKYTKKVRGEINSVKPDARKLVLKPASSEQGQNTTEQGEGVIQFKLAQDATVTVLGKGAQLEDLKTGQQAEIQYFVQDETNRAGSVKVTEQPLVAKTVAGEIKKVMLDRKKMWLKPSSEEQGETVMTFKLTQDATVTQNGQDAELTDVKAGQQAEIQYFAQDGINRADGVKIGETAAVSGPTPG